MLFILCIEVTTFSIFKYRMCISDTYVNSKYLKELWLLFQNAKGFTIDLLDYLGSQAQVESLSTFVSHLLHCFSLYPGFALAN